MLSFFRRNLFINLIFLLAFVVLLQLYFFFEWSEASFKASLNFRSLAVDSVLGNHYLQTLMTIILICVQAFLLSRYVIINKLSRALSLIPGACFALVVSFILIEKSFDLILVANLFFIIALGNLFSIYKKFRPSVYIFNAGLFLSISCMIYFPYAIFLFVMLMGLLSLRNTNVIEVLQLLFGFICGIFLTGVLLYSIDKLDLMIQLFTQNFSIPQLDFSNTENLIKPISIILIIVVLFFNQGVIMKKKNFDAIRKLEINYWIMFFSLIGILFIKDVETNHLMLVSVPVGLLTGLILERKENSITKEFLFLLALVFYFILVFKLI